jgi:hypothetical protein
MSSILLQNNYEIVNKLAKVVIPQVMDGEEVALAVVKYAEDGKYGIELDEELCTCSTDDFYAIMDENLMFLYHPELEEVGNFRSDTEEEALNLAQKITSILVFC